MSLCFRNGYWTAYSGHQPVVSFASFGEALAASAGVQAATQEMRLYPPTDNSFDRFSHLWGLRRFKPHEVRCLPAVGQKQDLLDAVLRPRHRPVATADSPG
jgi:hypothetical protein